MCFKNGSTFLDFFKNLGQPRRTKNENYVIIHLYMNIVAIIISTVITLFGFAGGGGSSSGGGGGGGGSHSSSSHSSSSHSSSSHSGSTDGDPALALATVFITILIIIAVCSKSSKLSFKDYNSTKEEKEIHKRAKEIFESYQRDWTDFNTASIKKYTTDHYYQHASLMLELLKNLHRTNKVSKLKVKKVYLGTPVKKDTATPIKLSITYSFAGLDEVITDDGKKLYSQYVSSAIETWNFIYDGKELKLDGISQPTESASHLVKSLADFAKDNQLFYSPDWGRYALPARGLIFGGASMKVADINNHVIGKWGDLLIQLYTYAKYPGQFASDYYIVGQINVPKDYLGVIVKSKKFKTSSSKPDKSYDKFELEWNEFNSRYDVYAASRDALPAFELLNPKFMEYLYNKNPSYNLEVVDNVIYIYAQLRAITEQDYAELLEVLEKAYAELEM